MPSLRIGTRKSALALAQTRAVVECLQRACPSLRVQIVAVSTSGDADDTTPLARMGRVGVFVRELEKSLFQNEIDIAVHSLKDVPTQLPDGLGLASVTKREDARDVLVSRAGLKMEELPAGARVGTSSLRRKAQILAWRPDLKVVDLRGNMDTRLRKIERGAFDAMVCAYAGLARLGRVDAISERLSVANMVPAVGQGALALETRTADRKTTEIARSVHDPDTGTATAAERSFLAEVKGGCEVPVGAYADMSGETLRLVAMIASEDGTRMVRGTETGEPERARDVGRKLAEKLMGSGGKAIMESSSW